MMDVATQAMVYNVEEKISNIERRLRILEDRITDVLVHLQEFKEEITKKIEEYVN